MKCPNVLNCTARFSRDIIRFRHTLAFLSFEFLSFDIVSNFGFRVSNFSTYEKTLCQKSTNFTAKRLYVPLQSHDYLIQTIFQAVGAADKKSAHEKPGNGY